MEEGEIYENALFYKKFVENGFEIQNLSEMSQFCTEMLKLYLYVDMLLIFSPTKRHIGHRIRAYKDN